MRLILFGTGMAASKLINYRLRPEHKIIAVVDNDSQKWGEIRYIYCRIAGGY